MAPAIVTALVCFGTFLLLWLTGQVSDYYESDWHHFAFHFRGFRWIVIPPLVVIGIVVMLYHISGIQIHIDIRQ